MGDKPKNAIGNRANVVKKVYNIACDASGKAILDERGQPTLVGEPVAVFRTKRNDVKQAMLGREIYWMTEQTMTEPVNYVIVSYASGASTAYCGTSKLSSQTTPTVATVWKATYSNTTGADVTVDTLSLINYGGSSDIVYCTDEGLSILVHNNQALVIEWEHIWSAGDSVVQTALLTRLQSYFESVVTSSSPIIIATFADTTAAYSASGSVVLQSGGTVADTQVVWTAKATNADDPALDHTCHKITGVNSAGDICFEATGYTVDWDTGEEVECTFTFTVAETGQAEVEEQVEIGESISVAK